MKTTLKATAIAISSLLLALPAMASQAPKAAATEAPKAEAPKAEAKSTPKVAAKTGTKAHVAKASVDINSATQEELEALPSIGKTYSAKIIAGRPYKTKTELTSRKIVPRSVYNKIKSRITAKS